MLVATVPPYAYHRQEIIEHPLVGGLRFNTIMPTADSKEDVLRGLAADCAKAKKPLWVDLKGRQLRITKFAYLPYAFVELSRKIKVKTPTKIIFKDCESTVVRVVDGNKLILDERPSRVVGAGEPVNILDPSLEIEGYLTDNDLGWIEAAKRVGVHRYMLSFAEKASDLEAVAELDPAHEELVAKIESLRGCALATSFADRNYDRRTTQGGKWRLMAARDDLYINLGHKQILDALQAIKFADPSAFVASRILTSLEERETVSMGDVSDLDLMRRMGYEHYLLSDGLCFSAAAFRRAMKVLKEWPWKLL